MLDLPNLNIRQVRSEISRRGFSLEEGLRWLSKDDSIAIPSDTNLESLKKINEIDDGSEASMSELITMLSCLFVGVVCVQSCTPVKKASDFWVSIFAGTGGSLVVCYPILEMGGAKVWIRTTVIDFEVGDETNDNLVVRSSSRFVVGISESEQ